MIIDSLLLIRQWLIRYQPLTDYLVDHYGRAGKHFVGLTSPKQADHFPFFAYILANEEEDRKVEGRSQVAIVRWDIYQPGFDETDPMIYLGPIEHAEVGELTLEAVLDGNDRQDPVWIKPVIRTLTDLYVRHPYYGGEMQLTLTYSAEFTEG